MRYIIHAPWWLRQLVPGALWSMPPGEKKIYLSFDDGPHPVITARVLDMLKEYQAGATFFCVGANVVKYPDVFQRIITEGHTVGNHTHHHLNGWKTKDADYLADVSLAAKYIPGSLFRPPYGRIGLFQRRMLAQPAFRLKIVMWSLLSGDFDPFLSPERCLDNVLLNAKDGDIIVFHDSEKAADRILYALPRVLEYFSAKGYRFEKLPDEGS